MTGATHVPLSDEQVALLESLEFFTFVEDADETEDAA